MNHQIERHGTGISKWRRLRYELLYPALTGLAMAAVLVALVLWRVD